MKTRLAIIRKRAVYVQHLAQMYDAPGSFARYLTVEEQEQFTRNVAADTGGRWASRKRGLL